ncbi:Predicted transcriptional regulator containing CBS domains [Pilibacter termitis]|uniref:Predicted transcriptional regulator containing CBS domains n=1 Tax=Pilibacter termitis TaxID=263852 RepID=A0A1T4QGS1_9ENTE|nr:DRTGG domain-containing protein [Pilibacter termitis]SKA02892.1 Predicted transcriptional regulator containing CBS domains [Pilibacter termitis]
MTKHEMILDYIKNLAPGDRISVRAISQRLKVSEGTSYRAIKEAQTRGLVATMDRVGTVRIEGRTLKPIEHLTFAEVARITDAEVLGGMEGIGNSLSNFIIGAMQKESIARYISKTGNGLMIVGNRVDIQQYALENGLAVLITGDFIADQSVILLANELGIPILKTSYDTFTTATMINRAMSEALIKKDIMHVSDVFTPLEKTPFLKSSEVIADYRKLVKKMKDTRFPVVTSSMRVVGVVSGSDILDKDERMSIEKVMTRHPIVAKKAMSIASVSHLMVWEQLEVLPVINEDETLAGVISRFDVMKAMQGTSRTGLALDTLSDKMRDSLDKEREDVFKVIVTPQLVNQFGTLSHGVLTEQIVASVEEIMRSKLKKNIVIEQINLFMLKLIPLESTVYFFLKVLETSRRRALIEVEGKVGANIVVKSMITLQLMERG